ELADRGAKMVWVRSQHRFQPESLSYLSDARADLRFVAPEIPRPERELLGDRPGEDLVVRVLEDVPDVPCQFLDRSPSGVDPADGDATGRRGGQAVEQLGHWGFP